MFLDNTLARNPGLIRTAFALHREGAIPPNCFVIDIDAVAVNAALLERAATENGLALYFTTKQVGFNPLLARCVVEAGIRKAIAIDAQEAAILSQNGIAIGHLGHLVQTPTQMIRSLLALEPEVVTVFCVEKARQISQTAAQDRRQIRLLLRVVSDEDSIFPGQEGGFCLETLRDEAAVILRLPNVRIAGVTSFPCLELDEESRTLRPTHNFHTIVKAAQILRGELGIAIEQINAPGNTCVAAMDILARMGATHGEPGHALTGTTYQHAYRVPEGNGAKSRPVELPAVAYVSEVSHLYGNHAYVFGGGTYRRAKINNALVGSRSDRLVRTQVLPLDPTAIDYYVSLALPPDHTVGVGDTVILASRVQIFVSRSYVAIAKGIQEGSPSLMGLFDSSGRIVERAFGCL